MSSAGNSDQDKPGRLVALVYLLFALVGVVVMIFGVYLMLAESIEFADGTRAFSMPGGTTIVRFTWPFAFGVGIWLAGAAIRLLLTGERAFPLRFGRVPLKKENSAR